MPKVSVIVPNYNHGPYLHERLRSIILQTFQDFEIIILDDCSTDDSRSIIELYQGNEKVSHIIYNTVNSGSTFRQWEKGVQLAKGEYIWLAESDDWCEPTFLETLVDGIESDKECTISYCQSYCVRDSNEILWQTSHSYLSELKDGKLFIKEKLLRNNSIVNASMAIWKRELFNKVTPTFFEYKFCGDWIFWAHLSSFGKVHISGKVLNYFRKHDADVTSRANKEGLNFWEELRVVTWLRDSKLVLHKDFFKTLKYKHRNYFLNKNALSPELVSKIEEQFSLMGLSFQQRLFLLTDGLYYKLKKKR